MGREGMDIQRAKGKERLPVKNYALRVVRQTILTSQGLAGSGSSRVKCPSTIFNRSKGFFLHENLDLEEMEFGRDPASGEGVGEEPPPESVEMLGVGQDSVALKSCRWG